MFTYLYICIYLYLYLYLHISISKSLSFLGPKIWDLVPAALKQSETLYSFKLKIKNWVLFECPCRIFKTYIQQVGFL